MPLEPPVMKTWRFLMGILEGRGRTIRERRRRRRKEMGRIGITKRR